MNENSVSSAQQITENKLIFFYPHEKCAYCDRLTGAAVITSGSFEPVCPEHGYSAAYSTTPTAREMADQLKTIERFVQWMYDDRGRLVLITPIDAKSVPGYAADPFEPSSMFADEAWSVQYEAPGGEHKD
jgi:hypothetical protein